MSGNEKRKFAESGIKERRLLEAKLAFEESKYYRSLSSIIRYVMYLNYAAEKHEIEVSENLKQRFKRKLGENDLNDAIHGQWTRIIFDRFKKFHDEFLKSDDDLGESELNLLKLDDDEVSLLQAALEFHDVGEWAKGDTRYDLKTSTEEKAEAEDRNGLIKHFLNGKYTDTQINQICDIISGSSKPLDQMSKLEFTFNTIERIGYLRTALKAWKNLDKLQLLSYPEDKTLRSAYLTTATNVILNQLEVLIERSKEFPYVRAFIESKKELINSIFIELNEDNDMYLEAFEIYPTTDLKNPKNSRINKINPFENARLAFERFETIHES